MIVSKQRKVLFVHVQKTGGSTIDRVLMEKLPGARPVRGLPEDRHAPWQVAIEEKNRAFANYYTFGFVRNPWARLDSWFRMIQRRKHRAAEAPDGRAARMVENNEFWATVLERLPTFESFVLEGPEIFPRLSRPQLHYLQTEGASGRRADFIGRTERLDADLAAVFGHLDLERPERVPRANSSRRTVDYHELYTPEMRDAVGAAFAPDVEAFGYDF